MLHIEKYDNPTMINMTFKSISNENITVDIITSLQEINYLQFINCKFYNVFHHMYNLTSIISLQLTDCDILKDEKTNFGEDITDSIANLQSLKAFSANTQTPIKISKKIFEMNLQCISLGQNIIIPTDVIYYNLMNYSTFYINYVNKHEKSNTYDIPDASYQYENTMLIIITHHHKNIDIPAHITKLNIMFTSQNIYDDDIQNMFDNLPKELTELKIINCNHEVTLTNLPTGLDKLYFLWTQNTRGYVSEKRNKMYNEIISNSKIPFGTVLYLL